MNNYVKYSVILFDLFDTLIFFEPILLPTLKINGKKRFSTALPVYKVFNKYFPDIEFGVFYSEFRSSYHEFQELKKSENKEYTNKIRFDIMFSNMGIIDLKTSDSDIKNQMVNAHMEALSSSMVFPETHREVLLHFYKNDIPMSIVSNFDHAPTAYKLLDKYDITLYFQRIFISDEVGWRKPHPNIFNIALSELGKDSSEAVLVGDDYDADIVGASDLGIDTVYLNGKEDNTEDIYNYRISELSQITDIIQV